MSYPMDLDEYDEQRLIAELVRRATARANGKCDYCTYPMGEPTPRGYASCRFPDRHNGMGAPLDLLRGVALGKADWVYDAEMDMHIPCCSQHKATHLGWLPKCGNGPLVGDQIRTGDCGEHG